MRNSLYLAALVYAALALPSCKIMYTPNMQNVPLMKEKGEVRATVGLSNFQGAYAVTENIGIVANGQYRTSKWSITSGSAEEKYESRKWLFEAGGGYFKPIGNDGVIEVYGGGGLGSLTFDRTSVDTGIVMPISKYAVNTARFFIQPAIGITSEYADFSFSTRLVGLKFNSVDTVNYTTQDLIDENIYGLDKPFYTFLEPALTVRFGFKYVKFHTQLMYSLKLNPEELNYVPLNLNLGIHINIAPRHQ